MSWLDSSFNFAKSALTQAQKSIDRVLDINEDKDGTASGKGAVADSQKRVVVSDCR